MLDPQWVIIIIISVGLIATWVKNGKSTAANLGSMETEIKNIKESVDKQTTTCNKVIENFDEFRVHCAGQTATVNQKVKALESKVFKKKER